MLDEVLRASTAEAGAGGRMPPIVEGAEGGAMGSMIVGLPAI